MRGAGTAFGRAGGEMDSAFTASMGAQGSLGARVHERRRAGAGPGAPTWGTCLRGSATRAPGWRGRRGRLAAVAEDLAATMRETVHGGDGLHGELQQTRSSWAARVAAAGTRRIQGAG